MLVIDEAYALHDPSAAGVYRHAVIDSLVEQIQPGAGADRAVLLLGYRRDMEQMLGPECTNAGLPSRFKMNEALYFDDYNKDELYEIVKKSAQRAQLHCLSNAATKAVELLWKERELANFGNARAVDNLLQRAMQQRVQRLAPLPLAQQNRDNDLLVEDFTSSIPAAVDPMQVLDGLSNCDKLRAQVRDMQAVLRCAEAEGRCPKKDCTFNWTFVGPPGTGQCGVAAPAFL